MPGPLLVLLDVVGPRLERGGEPADVPDQDTPAGMRGVQPLVGIERDGVGLLDPGKERPQIVGEDRRPAVRGVHVEPHVLGRGDLGDLLQGIDGPRGDGAGRPDDGDGLLR